MARFVRDINPSGESKKSKKQPQVEARHEEEERISITKRKRTAESEQDVFENEEGEIMISDNEKTSEDAFLESFAEKKSKEAESDFKILEEKVPGSGGGKKDKSLIWLYGLLGFLLIVGGVFGLGFLVSRANVEITRDIKQENVSFDASFSKKTASPDLAALTFPAQIISKTTHASQSFPTTGASITGGSKAQGTIYIYNNYGIDPQPLIATTRFLTSDGKLFRLVNRVVVPGTTMSNNGKLVPSSVTAEVAADQVGPDYNIGPTTFSIPGFAGTPRAGKFYAESKTAFSGGASGQVKTFSSSDFEKDIAALSQSTFQSMQSDLEQNLPPGFKMIDNASNISVSNIHTSVKTGSAADNVTVSFNAVWTSMIFDESKIVDAVRQKLTDPTLQTAPISDFLLNYTLKNIDFKKGTMVLTVNAQVNGTANIDSLALKQNLRGKSPDQITQELLAIPGVKEAKVHFWPSWVRKMPQDPNRITIIVH